MENQVASGTSKFSELYKNHGKTPFTSQEERREFHLKQQKERRHGAVDEKRNLWELFSEQNNDEPMEVETKKKKRFTFKLMESEWFTEIPPDLQDNWLVKLCPEGPRYLVIAEKGKTACYWNNGNGKPCFKFISGLPGGSYQNANKFTILDCIYTKEIDTFFIFDVLAWNSLSLINSDAQFRFFWLKSKFDENPEMLTGKSRHNFVVMDYLTAQHAIIQDFFLNPLIIRGTPLKFEGILFYHKEGLYCFGKTPLVGWLKSFMVPEKLFIDVHPYHMQNKPDNYINMEQFLQEKKKLRRRGKGPQNCEVEMEEVET